MTAVAASAAYARPEVEFITVARHLALAKGDLPLAREMAKQARATDRVQTILRSAVDFGGIEVGWGAALAPYRQISDAFAASLQSASVFDFALANGAMVLPTMTKVAISTIAISGDSPAESAPKPVSRLTLDTGALDPMKATAIVVATDELLRAAPALVNALLGRELRAGVSAATNRRFLAALYAASSPTASAGASVANMATDVAALINGITWHEAARPIFVFKPAAVAKMAAAHVSGAKAFPDLTATGGTIAGAPVIPSDALPAGGALLIDASGLALASDVIILDTATSASIEMDSAPGAGAEASPPSPELDVMVSLWQRNMVGLKAERTFFYELLRSTAVASLSGVAY